ncbi:SNF1 kinase complex beta-subunit [Mycena kentingensis (nom. inval.)]|nr:SNF1 kinase complex beta-subunit [Mycena kentingensis (nom. inval.)]
MGNSPSQPAAPLPPSTPRASQNRSLQPPPPLVVPYDASPDPPPSAPNEPAHPPTPEPVPSYTALRPNRKSIELPGLNTFAAPPTTTRFGRMRASSSRLGERGRSFLNTREGRHANGSNANGSFTTNGRGRGKTAAIAIPVGRRGREDEELESGYGRHAEQGIARRKAEIKAAAEEQQRRRGRSATRSCSAHAIDNNTPRPESPWPSTNSSSPPRSRTNSPSSSRSPSSRRGRRNGAVAPHPSPDRSSANDRERERRLREQLYGPPPQPTASAPPGFKEEIVFSTIPLTIGANALIGAAEGDEDEYDEEEEDVEAAGNARTRAVAAVVDEIVGAPQEIVWRSEWRQDTPTEEVYLIRAGDQDWLNRTKMERQSPDGLFTTTVYLPPGTHHFRFIVDGNTIAAPPEGISNAVDDQGFITNYVTVPGSTAVSPTSTSPVTALPSPAISLNAPALWAAPGPGPVRTTSLRRRARPPSMPVTPAVPTPVPPLHPDGSFWFNSSQGGSSEDVGRLPDATATAGPRRSAKAEWTSEIPPELVAAAAQEEQWLDEQLRRHHQRREITNTLNGRREEVAEPSIPPAAHLPRHLERLILNRPSPGVVIPKPGSGAGNTGFTLASVYGAGRHSPSPGPPLRVTTASGTDVSMPANSMMMGFASMSNANANARTRDDSPGANSFAGGTPLIADDPSVLQTPSHAVLYHLCTSSIKDKMIAVATSTRYRRKYLTTVYYKPAELDEPDPEMEVLEAEE